MISIDGSVFIQIINFLFLIWILNLLLYKPIRNIIRRRQEKFSGLETEIETSHNKAAVQDAAFSDGLKAARARGLQEKNQLLQDAAEKEKEIVGRINEKAQADFAAVRRQIEQDVEKARQALSSEVDRFAESISEKILGRTI